MKQHRNLPELLAPAGDIEKLETAIRFGADAVYVGLQGFSLRGAELSLSDLAKARDITTAQDKKLYLALNSYARDKDFARLTKILPEIHAHAPDALIVSDPGIIDFLKTNYPDWPLHLSVQANTLNIATAGFWQKLGIKRLVAARELSQEELASMVRANPKLEIEMFVHGAMCMALSGRCFLSQYLAGRDANQGNCAQPCRWAYQVRPDVPSAENETLRLSLQDSERGSYIFNAADLCLIEHLPDIIKTGVASLKIEGRMKPAYYVALATICYREALDNCAEFLAGQQTLEHLQDQLKRIKEELGKVSHRPYSTGFFAKREKPWQAIDSAEYVRDYNFVGVVKSWQDGQATIQVRNRLRTGDLLESIDPQRSILEPIRMTVPKMLNHKDNQLITAAHNQYTVSFPVTETLSVGAILRVATGEATSA